MMEINGVNIAYEDLRILRYIVSNDGADAPEIRDVFGIENSSSSSHRLDKLEEAGLIESEYPNTSHPGRLAPRLARPTQEAKRVIADFPESDTPRTLTAEERLDRLETRFDTARMRILSLRQDVEELENRLDNHGLVFDDRE